MHNKHPNHLCVDPRANISIACPFRRSTALGLCGWVVSTFSYSHVQLQPHLALPQAPSQESSQVSPNARRRAQCKGGGGKEKKYMYTKKCQTLYNLQASLRERRRNNYIKQKSRKHGKRESHRAAFLATISQLPRALYLQNISNFVSQVCCGRPRGGYVGRGCHASVLLTQRSAGKFAM